MKSPTHNSFVIPDLGAPPTPNSVLNFSYQSDDHARLTSSLMSRQKMRSGNSIVLRPAVRSGRSRAPKIESINPLPSLDQLRQIVKRRECQAFLGIFFLLIASLSASAILIDQDLGLPSSVPIYNISEAFPPTFFGTEDKVYIGLTLEETGLHILSITAEEVDGVATFDPTAALWGRPDTFLDSVDDFGPENVNPFLHFNVVEENQLEDYFVVEVSSLEASSEGNFNINVLRITPNLLDLNTPTTLTLSPLGAIGGLLALTAGQTYVLTAYSSDSDLENTFNTALYMLDINGAVLASSYGTSTNDFSARLMFTAPVTDIFAIEVRLVDTPLESLSNRSFRVQIKEVFPAPVIPAIESTEANGSLTVAASSTYRFQAQKAVTYSLSLEVSFSANSIQSYARQFDGFNRTAVLPRYLPALKLTLFDVADNVRIESHEMDVIYAFNLSDIEVVVTIDNVSKLEFDFISAEDREVIVDIHSLNPEYFSEEDDIEIGEFSLVMSISDDQVGEADTLVLVDPNDPFASCSQDPLEMLALGCMSGVYIYCRHQNQPFLSFEGVTTATANEVCACTQFLCVEFPTGELQSESFDSSRQGLSFLLVGVCVLCIFMMLYLTYDYLYFKHTEGIVWKVNYLFAWLLSFSFCVVNLIYLVTNYQIDTVVDLFQSLSDAFTRRGLSAFDSSDSFYYESSPFDDIFDLVQNIPTAAPTSPRAELYLNDGAISVFNSIGLDLTSIGNSVLFVRAILSSIVLLIFLEMSASWVQSSSIASSISRARHEQARRRMFMYIRGFEISIGLSSIWYTIALFNTDGEAFSNIVYILYSICYFLAAGLLWYARFKFTQMLTFEKRAMLTQTSLGSTENKQLQEALRPVQDVSVVLLLCSFGMGVVNIYFATIYRTKQDRVQARNRVIPSTFEVFAQALSTIGVLTVLWFLLKSYFETKKLFIATFFYEETVMPTASKTDISETYNKTKSVERPPAPKPSVYQPSGATVPDAGSVYYNMYTESDFRSSYRSDS